MEENKIKSSIAIKISVLIGCFVIILQLLSGFISFRTERSLITGLLDDLWQTSEQNFENQKKSQLGQLNKNLLFNSKTIASVVANGLYNMDDVASAIRPFMDIEEIQAIVVFDEKKESYEAVWRDNGLKSGKKLPTTFLTTDLKVADTKAMWEDTDVGGVNVYYTARMLTARFKQLQKSTEENFEQIRQNVSGVQVQSAYYQVLGLSLAVIAFLAIIFFLIRRIVQPLRRLAGLMQEIETSGDFGKRAEASGSDEVGGIAGALNSLLNNLQTSINGVNTVMSAVAEGDLEQRVTTDHKGDLERLKTSINESVELLSRTITQATVVSEKVFNSSKELSSSSQSLATGTSQQAASIEEISSTLDEVQSQTDANSNNAQQAQQLSDQTMKIVEQGNQQMESMLSSITNINQSSAEVSKVIKVIDEIAFQTNLLALNAAVEAARAGKYGKGFAVVAEEVRNLAGRSAEAAKDTTELIETSIKEVEKGVKNADQTAAILNQISEGMTKNNDLVLEISAASQEQGRGIKEVNQGVSQVSDVVQQNSSISEESASASQELTSQATILRETLTRFKTGTRIGTEPTQIQQIIQNEPKQLLTPKTITLDDDDFGKY